MIKNGGIVYLFEVLRGECYYMNIVIRNPGLLFIQ